MHFYIFVELQVILIPRLYNILQCSSPYCLMQIRHEDSANPTFVCIWLPWLVRSQDRIQCTCTIGK